MPASLSLNYSYFSSTVEALAPDYYNRVPSRTRPKQAWSDFELIKDTNFRTWSANSAVCNTEQAKLKTSRCSANGQG